MTEHRDGVCRFPVPRRDELPGDIADRIADIERRTGFVPNVAWAMARRPAEFRAFFDYHSALMEKEGPLSKAERELIVVATSAANGCVYCVVAHGAVLRIRSKDPCGSDIAAIDYHRAGLGERAEAILDLAMKVSLDARNVSAETLGQARSRGLTDDEIWDIIAISAFFAMSNRLASAIGLQPNREFHTMAR